MGKTLWEGRLPLGEHAIDVRNKWFYLAKHAVTLEQRKQRELRLSLEHVPDPPGFWTGQTVGATTAMGIGLVGMGLFGAMGDWCCEPHRGWKRRVAIRFVKLIVMSEWS